MKKIFSLVAAVTLCLGLCVSASAQGDSKYRNYGYYIENYEVNSVLQENNKMQVTEKILVNYNEQRQGIFRIIPIKPKVDRIVDGVYKEMTYRTKIENLEINDNFKQYEEDGYLMIKIGTEGRYNIGEKEYILSYTMDMGDDRIDSSDELFYSFIGGDWDCPIENASFSLQYPKTFDESEIKLYSGYFGSTDSSNVEYTVKDNKLSGHIINPLEEREAITVYTMLPQGYFMGTTKPSAAPAMAFSLVALALLAFIVYGVMASKNSRKSVQTVEFYPPEGITSAQVGYIMDGVTSDKEVLSLIVWLADKKYISIKEESKDITILSKTQKSVEDMPSHVKPLYDGIFESGDSVDIATLNLYESVRVVGGIAGAYFKGERKLQSPGLHVCATVAALLLIVAGSVGLALYGGGINDQLIVVAAMEFIFSLILLFVCQIAANGWCFFKKGVRLGYTVVGVILTLIPTLLTFFIAPQYSFGGVLLPIATALMVSAGCYLSALTAVYTEYMRSLQGKLLGLREFINEAEKEKLEYLVEENPEYFFNVLPYAYVFGLTDKWINKFEAINLASPVMAASMMHTCYIVNRTRARIAPPAPVNTGGLSSGRSFGSSYSGGGFSGGGFGGGGGRSW